MSPAFAQDKGIEFYMELLDVIREGIVCTDEHGTIIGVNRSALGLLGYEAQGFLGSPIEILFVDEDRLRCCPFVLQETLERGAYDGEFLLQRKDGTRFPGNLNSSWIRGEGGRRDLIFVIHDLTEQKRLQRRLLDSQKSVFLAKVVEGLSHEVRNPIVAIGGYARRLERVIDPGHPAHNYVRIMLQDVSRMEGMLREIEGYVRFAQSHRPSFARVDLHRLVLDAFAMLAIPEGIRVEHEFPPDGPWIYGDSGHLRELFYHLLENAVEAMPDGGTLGVVGEVLDSKARVTVRDTGIGIPDKALPHLFSPFFTTKTKGAGVGLAKAYIIVEEHCGQIEVDSRVDRGTAFVVTFPLDRRQRSRQGD